MNIIDWIILGILGVSVLIGLYRGFIASVASMGGSLLSVIASFWLSPRLVSLIRQNPEILKTLMSYADVTSRLGDLNLSQTAVSGLSSSGIAEVLNRVSLPAPLSSLLQSNLENQVFASSGLTQVGDYVSQTVAGAILNVLCFIVCFVGLMILFHFVLNFLKVVFRFPVLKQMNALVGGVFGLLRGALLCFVAFALLPLIQTMIPLEGIPLLIEESTLAPLFNSGTLILAMMRGSL